MLNLRQRPFGSGGAHLPPAGAEAGPCLDLLPGVPFSVEGEFLEIDPPRKLVQTWKPEWDEGHVPGVAHNVHDSPVTGIEIFVAFQNPRLARREQHFVRPEIDGGNAGLDVGK